MMRRLSHATASALCGSLVLELCVTSRSDQGIACDSVTQFVLGQQQRMPDFFRLPIRLLTLTFAFQALVKSGRCFHQHAHGWRWRHIQAWRNSRFGFRRDLIRFYESLTVFGWSSDIP